MQDGEDADAEPDADNGGEHINNTPHCAEASPAEGSEPRPWPFPTAASMSVAQADQHDS